MSSFRYDTGPDRVRRDLAEAHRRAWAHVAAPGTWLSGAERIAVTEETRRARDCRLCRERKGALSPFAIEGEHDCGGLLPAAIVDEVHRVTTDAARLTESWYRSLLDQGLSSEAYVEALGVAGIAGLVGNGVIEDSVTPSLVALGLVSLFVVGWGIVRHSFQRGVGLVLLAAYGVIVALGA